MNAARWTAISLLVLVSTAASAVRTPWAEEWTQEAAALPLLDMPSDTHGFDLVARRVDGTLQVALVGAEAEEWVWLMVGSGDPSGHCSQSFGDECEAFADADVFRVLADLEGRARFEHRNPDWPDELYVQVGSHRGHEGDESTLSPVRPVR